MTRFDFETFSRDQQNVAQIVPASMVFSLLNRRARMPADCVGLAWSSGDQPRIVRAGTDLDGDGIARILVVRVGPFGLEYQLGGFTSQDGHGFTAQLQVKVDVVPERSELSAFARRVIGSGERVTLSQLTRHCEEAVRLCAATFCKERKAEDLLRMETWEQFDKELAEGFRSFGFDCGMALGADVRAEFRSPAFGEMLRQKKADEARKQRFDADAAMRAATNEMREKHVASLAAMTEKVRAIAVSGPEISVKDLIRTFDPAQRGELYGSLLSGAVPERKATAILLVAGDEIIAIDATSRKIGTRRLVDAKYGPLRSIRTAKHQEHMRVLVGARNGVHVFDSNLNPIDSFGFEPQRMLRGGINSATVFLNEYLFASHSEVGLIGWKLEGPEKSSVFMKIGGTSDARAVRDVQVDDSGIMFVSIDRKVKAIVSVENATHETEYPVVEAETEVSALLVADGYAYAGLVNGAIQRWHAKSGEERQIFRPRTNDSVESLDWLAGGGVPRLLVADKRPLVELRVIGDAYTAEYHAPQAIRWAWSGERFIAGVNDRRDSVFLWDLDKPSLPSSVVQVGRLCSHSIHDAAILF